MDTLKGRYPVVARTPDVALGAVLVTGPEGYDETTTWSQWHGTTAVISRRPRSSMIGTRLDMVGDGFAASGDKGGQADQWLLQDVHMTRVHDDAIENDLYSNGTIDDCLIDGTMVFLSELWGSDGPEPDGSKNLVTVVRTLVRLESYHNSYKPDKYGYDQHGGLFKWSKTAPVHSTSLMLDRNVFAAAMVPKYGGTIDLPPQPNVTATGNTLIWLGEGTWPEAHLKRWRATDPELTVLAGADAWAAAVNVWHSQRP